MPEWPSPSFTRPLNPEAIKPRATGPQWLWAGRARDPFLTPPPNAEACGRPGRRRAKKPVRVPTSANMLHTCTALSNRVGLRSTTSSSYCRRKPATVYSFHLRLRFHARRSTASKSGHVARGRGHERQSRVPNCKHGVSRGTREWESAEKFVDFY